MTTLLAIIVIITFILSIRALIQVDSSNQKIDELRKELSRIRQQLSNIKPPVSAATKPQETKPADLPPIPTVQPQVAARAAAPTDASSDLQDTLNIAKRAAEEKHAAPAEPAATYKVAPQEVKETPQPKPQPVVKPAPYIPPVPPVVAKLVQPAPKPTRPAETNYDAPLAFIKKFLFKENSGELNVGKRLMAVGGFIILFLTSIFFLRYMFHRGMITPAMQVGIIIAAGAAVAGLGNFLCIRKIQPLGQLLTALGMAVIYAAFVAGMSDLYSPPVFEKNTAFVCMSIVALYGMGVSLAFNTPVIAFMSLLAGFAVPPLVSTGQNHREALFIYVTILNLATLGLVFARQWRVLASVSMAGTYLLFIGWMNAHYTDAQSTGTLWWLIYFAMLFIIMNLAWNVRKQVALAEYQVVSLLVNGLVAIAISSYIFNGVLNNNAAYFAWIAGGVYMALALLIRAKIPADYTGRLSMLLLGMSLATYGVPLYFGERVVFLIWAFESVMVLAVGWMYRNRLLKVISGVIIVLSFCAFMWAEVRFPRVTTDWLFINPFFGRVLIISVSMAAYGIVNGFFAWRNNVFQHHKTLSVRILTLSNIILTTGILVEYGLFADQNNIPDPTVMHFFTLVLLVQSMVFTGAGLRLVMSELATLGIIVLGGAGFCVAGCFEDAPENRTLIFNTQFINAILWMIVCLYTAWDFKKHPVFGPALLVAKYLGNLVVVTFWLLICTETHRYVSYAFTSGGQAELMADTWTMLVWSTYATGLLMSAVYFGVRSTRLIAIALIAAGTAKFLFDYDMTFYSSAVPVLIIECVLLGIVGKKTQCRSAWLTALLNIAASGVMAAIIFITADTNLRLFVNLPFVLAMIWCLSSFYMSRQLRKDETYSFLESVGVMIYSGAFAATLALICTEVHRYISNCCEMSGEQYIIADKWVMLIWAVYASAALVTSVLIRRKLLHYLAVATMFAWTFWWLFEGGVKMYELAAPILLAECVLLGYLAKKSPGASLWCTAMANIAAALIMILYIFDRCGQAVPLVFNTPFLYALAWNGVCAFMAFQARSDSWDIKLHRLSNGLYSAVVGGLLVLLSYEVYRYVEMSLGYGHNARSFATIAMTLVWVGYASIALTIGFIWRLRPLRYFSLALLFLSGAKFILVDSVRFESLIRIIASFSIGVIMLITAGAYHKLSSLIAKPGDTDAK